MDGSIHCAVDLTPELTGTVEARHTYRVGVGLSDAEGRIRVSEWRRLIAAPSAATATCFRSNSVASRADLPAPSFYSHGEWRTRTHAARS
jgi:hypothetical protein